MTILHTTMSEGTKQDGKYIKKNPIKEFGQRKTFNAFGKTC